MKKLVSCMFICLILHLHAGRQNGKTIFDQIIVVNDTNNDIIIDNYICEAGEEITIENKKWLKEQTQKLIDIYLPLEKQSLKFPYLTYGAREGDSSADFNSTEVKISELLKEKNNNL